MKLKKVPYYMLDHDKVCESMNNSIVFINEFNVTLRLTSKKTIKKVCAVYKNIKPDRKEGHKDYMLLYAYGDQMFRSGRDKNDLREDRFQQAVHCKVCDTVIYSLYNHDFIYCGCPNEAHVDGGPTHSMYGARDMNKVEVVTIDFLTDSVLEASEMGKILYKGD